MREKKRQKKSLGVEQFKLYWRLTNRFTAGLAVLDWKRVSTFCLQLTFFAAILVISGRAELSGRNACIPCIRAKKYSSHTGQLEIDFICSLISKLVSNRIQKWSRYNKALQTYIYSLLYTKHIPTAYLITVCILCISSMCWLFFNNALSYVCIIEEKYYSNLYTSGPTVGQISISDKPYMGMPSSGRSSSNSSAVDTKEPTMTVKSTRTFFRLLHVSNQQVYSNWWSIFATTNFQRHICTLYARSESDNYYFLHVHRLYFGKIFQSFYRANDWFSKIKYWSYTCHNSFNGHNSCCDRDHSMVLSNSTNFTL